MLDNAWLFLLLYLSFATIFNESYKIISQNMKQAGALTVVVELIAGIFSLLWIPFFEMQVPKDPKVYFLLGLAIIFYTAQNRLATTARSGIEASTYGILKQISNVFVTIMGFLFLKETLTLKKIIGSIFLIGSNIFIFYQKGKWKNNKYIVLGIIANLCMGMALFLDVNTSSSFNLALYVAIILLLPSILTLIIEKIKINQIKREWNYGLKYLILLTGISWSFMMITKLKAYQLGEVTKIAPLCSLTVILNVIFSYIFLKERKNTIKKIIASIFIIFGIFMIK